MKLCKYGLTGPSMYTSLHQTLFDTNFKIHDVTDKHHACGSSTFNSIQFRRQLDVVSENSTSHIVFIKEVIVRYIIGLIEMNWAYQQYFIWTYYNITSNNDTIYKQSIYMYSEVNHLEASSHSYCKNNQHGCTATSIYCANSISPPVCIVRFRYCH